MPDRMPDRMPENMSDRMPEDLPVTKCINVMVGITRSKVILFGDGSSRLFIAVFWGGGTSNAMFVRHILTIFDPPSERAMTCL